MESQPRNPEFSINPENFHPCEKKVCMACYFILNLQRFVILFFLI